MAFHHKIIDEQDYEADETVCGNKRDKRLARELNSKMLPSSRYL